MKIDAKFNTIKDYKNFLVKTFLYNLKYWLLFFEEEKGDWGREEDTTRRVMSYTLTGYNSKRLLPQANVSRDHVFFIL